MFYGIMAGFVVLLGVITVLTFLIIVRKPSTKTVYVPENTRITRSVDDIQNKPTLVVKIIEGMTNGHPVAVAEEKTIIGADNSSDIVLNHPTVSRKHAEIVRDDSGQFHIYNRSKINKLQVNGMEVSSAVLNDKDTLTIGAIKLQVIAA